jgi:AraC-like DNA-binding protein
MSNNLTEFFAEEISRLPVPYVCDFVTLTLMRAGQGMTVEHAVRHIGVTRQCMAQKLQASGLRRPLWYVSSARLLYAARYLEHREFSIMKVAMACRFGAASDLYNMYRTYTGLSVAALRERGIFSYMRHHYRAGLSPAALSESGRRVSNEVHIVSI